MRKVFNFGKVDFRGSGKKSYPVEVDVELNEKGGMDIFKFNEDGVKEYTGEQTPKYMELSICAKIKYPHGSDSVVCGQCLDYINDNFRTQLNDIEFWDEIYNLWKNYHLNGMHAGTPEQEEAVKEWEAEGHSYNYADVCDMLRAKGLYIVKYTGNSVSKIYNDEFYTYGHGWLVQTLPVDVEMRLKEMLV